MHRGLGSVDGACACNGHPASGTGQGADDLLDACGSRVQPRCALGDLRAACEADQTAYKQKDPVGFNWFANAGNGFSGFPYLLQRILPELAPEIWGRPEESFARFGLLPRFRSVPAMPRGLGIASTAGRPVNANNDPTGEIDFAKPGLHVVTLACGACHTGQVRTEGGIRIFDGAPNTQVDVRKWREAYGLTVQNYLSSLEQITSTAQRITAIIDSKPDGYFYPKDYFSGPGFLNFSPASKPASARRSKRT